MQCRAAMLRLILCTLAYGLCFAARADAPVLKPADASPFCAAYAGKVGARRDGEDMVITCPVIKDIAEMLAKKFGAYQELIEQKHEMLPMLSHSTFADAQRADWSAGCEANREAAMIECVGRSALALGFQVLLRYSFDAEGDFKELKLLVPSFEPVYRIIPGEVYQPFKDLYLELVLATLQANAIPNEELARLGPGFQVVLKALKAG
jgi:hypothetical protein